MVAMRRRPLHQRATTWRGHRRAAAAVVSLGAVLFAAPAASATVPQKKSAPLTAANKSLAKPTGGLSLTASAPGALATADRIRALVAAAKSQIGRTTQYDPAYVALAYPGGDVPLQTGVCTDVVIRAFRAVGSDLQVSVHEDMLRHFSAYPATGRTTPDANIDHRRVKNLATFFARAGASAPQSQIAGDYAPGDIVMWDVSGLAHTGLVVDDLVPGTDRHMIVHNIGDGAQEEDILFAFPITGHFRYLTGTSSIPAA